MIFILFASLIFALIFLYIGRRLIHPARFNPRQKAIAWILLLFLFSLPFTAMILNRLAFNRNIVHTLGWIGFTALGFFALLFVLLTMRDLIRLVSAGLKKTSRLFKNNLPASFSQIKTAEADPDRRAFLTQMVNLGLLGLSASAAGYGMFQARRSPQIVEVDIPLKKLPGAFHGLRIVQFSDLHAGATIKGSFVRMVVDSINSLNPDMIVFTGDLVDGTVEALKDDVAVLGRLSAPLGKFFITGNHEYFSGAMRWIAHVKQLGFEVLLNEHRRIRRGRSSLILAGVTDYRAGYFFRAHEFNPERAAQGTDEKSARIMLAHQPKGVERIAEAGFDLQISGHTHGGQFFPGNFLARLDQPYIAGLHRYKNMWVYVNSGTGYWGPPLRLGTRSEITILRLLQG